MDSKTESEYEVDSRDSRESDDSAGPIDMSSFALPDLEANDDDEESSESYKEDFWFEDLVWPDPCGLFPARSGIKPALLTTKIDSTDVDIELGSATRCQMSLVVKRRPRPTELPWNVVVINSDPPIIEEDDVEEYLVHDPLFVEFFNAFLSLPSFPEPICFNVETGGFEVVSDDKQKLAQQIKEAVRSQHTMSKKYEVTRQHAFSDMPVVPIEDNDAPETVKIDTSFQVITLNKDQGIYWIKSERLPIFLESDFYFHYRLAKVISQVRIVNDKGEFVVMKIDFTSRPKKKKKTVEVTPPELEETIVKEMFVSFGDVKGAAKEAWFTQAKNELKTQPTYSTLSLKPSTIAPSVLSHDVLEQKEKSSVFHSQYFGVYTPGLIGPFDSEPPINDYTDKMFSKEKPFTPRPSDKIHSSTAMLRKKICDAEEEMVPAGNVLFVWPKQDHQTTDAESGIGEMDEKDDEFEKRITAQPIIDQIYYDGSWESGGTGEIILRSVDELGSVIVGAVMKKTIAEMLDIDEKIVLADPAISSIYPSMDLTCVSTDRLENLVVAKKHSVPEMDFDIETLKPLMVGAADDKEPVHIKWDKPMPKPAEEESDADSLLDSDEDFEERDIHFRRKKDKWHSLTSLKGIMAFKKFLEGTHGEKYWELWIDIDKGRLINTEEEKQRYILHMRDKYYKKGSPFELSQEDKKKLGLENLSSWCPKYLFQVHAKVLEPLVLYWAPRYLLKHLLQTHPEKYYLYNQMKSSLPAKESDPFPHTQELLPLRPKSCCPRIRTGPGVVEEEPEKNITSLIKPKPDPFATTPLTGNKRVYGEDTIKRLMKTPTAKYLGLKPQSKPKQMRAASAKSIPCNVARSPSVLLTGRKSIDKIEPSAGKLTGVSGKNSEELINAESKMAALPSKSCTTGDKVPCPSKPLTAILGERSVTAGLTLAPLKKPRDLLSPMMKIVDTHHKKSRLEGDKGKQLYTFYRQDSQEASKVCPKPGEPLQEDIHYAEMTDCEFMGSERMEFLLQALHHEQDSGRSFRKYIHKSERMDWINHLDFWEKVQEYRKLFYKDKLDLHLIAKQAKLIFAQCIVEGAAQGIGVSESIELSILDHLTPAYEDLFDEAEEFTLKALFEAFQRYLNQDVKSYCKVERAEIKRRLETKNNYILNLQKKGILKERSLTPDDPMEGYKDPVYDDSVLQRIPSEFKHWTLDKLIHNRIELEHFRQHLKENFAEIDLKCWMDIEAWRRTPHDDAKSRDQRARDIKKNYLNRKYFFGPSSPAGKEGQNRVMELGGGWGKFLEDKPHSSSILEAQKYVRQRLENKHLPLFLLSKGFQSRNTAEDISEGTDDLLATRKRRAQAVLKLLESRWISSTKEIYMFNKALLNPLTCQQFQKFVSLQGEHLENDILFWLEVEKYKHLHNTHTDEGLLQQKVSAIINCFIDSSIPPSLQIDIPQEMADKILDHKHEKNPYLFREAQLAVFRILLQYWQPFCDFRANMDSDTKVLKTLERHRLIADYKEKIRREEIMTQREKERLQRIEMGIYSEEMDQKGEEEGEEKTDHVRFSYSAYLEEQEQWKRKLEAQFQLTGSWEDWVNYQHALGNYDLENMKLVTVADRGSQTIRCIPQYPNQPVEERPGYQDDPDVEPEAKEYDIEDYIMYRNYLNIEVPNIRKEFCRKTVFAQQSAAEQQREKERKKFERSKSKDLSRDLSLINKDLNRTPSKNTDIKNRGSPISETDLTKDY
uniref:RGS domain-containing protein n=2 Tax=Biomphalaria glabrata TaxID=6526 RepID=A0A2C9JRT5_BIOGL